MKERRVESITTSPTDKPSLVTYDLMEFVKLIDELGANIFGDSQMNETDHVMLGYGDKVDMTAPENVLYRFLMTTLFSAKAKKFIDGYSVLIIGLTYIFGRPWCF